MSTAPLALLNIALCFASPQTKIANANSSCESILMQRCSRTNGAEQIPFETGH